jgi:hypothetical protein
MIAIVPLYGQSFDFPVDSLGFAARPDAPLRGPVQTMITTSFGSKTGLQSIVVDSFDQKRQRVEHLSSIVQVEEDTGNLLNQSLVQAFIYDNATEMLAEVRSFESNGTVGSVLKLVYYPTGRLREMNLYSKDGKLTDKASYSYNDKTREVMISTEGFYGVRTIVEKRTLLFDKQSRLAKRISFDRDGGMKDTVSYEFDSKGFLTKESTCCNYNFFYTFEYQFDKLGNWIERTETYSQKNGSGKWVASVTSHTFRTISHYQKP